MEFGFEVRESDLMGRIGLLRVGKKVLETPCLFPVIHPVRQLIPPETLWSMGFHGLMTNSYIILSRRKDEALSRGLHDMLGFQGVFMTDSGGYQVLEYGELEYDYSQIAKFQAEIGSELAVTLDRPTGFSESEVYARGTMEYSLKNAIATIGEYGDRDTVWIGPVQGGLFPKLLAKSATSMVEGGFRFLALGSPVQVMENYRFAELVRMIVATKKAIPYSVPLHLFGAGHPLTMALAIALGCDTFDSASYILFARGGRYMTERGVSKLDSMAYLPCSCPVCTRTTLRGLLDLDGAERVRALATHNLYVLRREIEACKEAIAEGRLWDLVQEKAVAHPKVHAALTELGRAKDLLKEGTPPFKSRGLFIRNDSDFRRPEVVAAGERLSRAMARRAKTAVILDADGTLPVTKTRLASAIRDETDAYLIHPALGPYPVELEFVYPFTQTVTAFGPVGLSQQEEAARVLRKMGYARVLLAIMDTEGRTKLKVMSRRNRRGTSPSVPSSSAPPRSPRRP